MSRMLYARWETDMTDKSDILQKFSLTLVGLALTTRLVSDIWFDLFGRFCDFNLGLFVE